jgi:VanZ family protein
MAVIFIASSIPNLTQIPGDVSDKTAHFAAYAILGALILRARVGGSWTQTGATHAISAWTLACAYAVSDEWHQTFVPGRTAAWDDLLADALGAGVSVLLAWMAGVLARRRQLTRRKRS